MNTTEKLIAAGLVSLLGAGGILLTRAAPTPDELVTNSISFNQCYDEVCVAPKVPCLVGCGDDADCTKSCHDRVNKCIADCHAKWDAVVP